MNYEDMNLTQLRAAAKGLGIKGITAMKKGELLDLLNAVKGHQQALEVNAKQKEAGKAEPAGRMEETQEGTDSGEIMEKSNRREAGPQDGARKTVTGADSWEMREKNTRQDAGQQEGGRRLVTGADAGETREEAERRMPYRRDPDQARGRYEVDYSQDSGREANGILEIMADGFGFIRCENYLPGENDIYVAPATIKRMNLKTGDIIVGNTKIKTEREKFAALLYVKSINGYTVEEAMRRKNFEDLTPIFPDERIRLENEYAKGISMRIMDLLAPIGKGQRGMIVAPPKAGKTTLLKQIAVSISRAYRDMHLIVLLIDERPEEVTDIRETIEGPNVEVIYSTFDELPEHHKRVSEMVLERAKRLVEHKEDVVILLDSITRLARAYNLTVPPSGRTLTGGLDPAALHMPKKFFGAARNMREGGSLTVLATALVDTGSKMDDVVFEEFKGTGNMELVLDRRLSEKRIFPAIDITKSGTRRDDLLLNQLELEAVEAMHKEFSGNRAEDTVEEILRLFLRTKNNREFLELVKRSLLRKERS